MVQNKYFRLAVSVLTAVILFSCSGSGIQKNDAPNNYGFKYPTNCWGGGAVWWEMHENRIYQQPGVKEEIVDGHQDAWYSVSLDLYQCGYLGINDYFNQILAAGYTQQDGASPDEWVNGKNKLVYTQFFQGEEPYETYGVIAYHKNRTIRLEGNRSDGSVSAKYDAPSLTITYKYFEQYY